MTKLIYLVYVSMLSGGVAYGQSITVSGRVTAETGRDAIPGVNVSVEGTTTGTTTNAEGIYQLNLPSGKATVVFSYIGYVTQRIAVGERTRLDVTLTEDAKSLNEVVVVGYGTVRKSDLTGSLSQVKTKEINAFPATNVLQALSGRAAGVQVLQNTGAPGGAVSVRIRGTNSIQGSNEPLYVIDGFPTAGTNPTILNNADIETIEVLKDASATAIYGSRGANGVVLITTKRGKAGKTQVDYEGSYSVQTLRKKLDLLNASEYIQFYNGQAANDKVTTPYFTQDMMNAAGQGGYDWQGSIFRKAPMQNHALTVSGGNDKTQFSVSGSVFGQQGIIKGSDYNRYSLRTNLNHQINSKFSLSLASTLSRINTSRQNSSGSNRGNSLISSVLSLAPILNPYDADGHYTDFTTILPWAYFPLNPLYTINETTDKVRANRILTNAAVTYKPFPELAIRISGGIENSDDRNDTFSNRVYNKNNTGSNGAGIFTTQANSLLSENTATYTKAFGKHSVSALAGVTYQNFTTRTLNATGQNFISNSIETGDIGSAGTVGVPASSYSYATLLSYLGRINYNFGDRYLATISFRSDGSSRYSEGNKRGYFPSGALAWRVSNEKFMKGVLAISDLKLRVGYGLTGSQAINPYTTLTQLAAGKTVFDDALYTYYAPSTTLPGSLKWETTEQTDFGLDLGVLQNRIQFTADYYIKNTRDLLNTVRLPSSQGYTTTIRNIGAVQNKGLELGINGRVLTGPFQWDVNANISFNRNKVVSLYGGQDILGSAFNLSVINDNISILREGRPIGQFYGYVEDGYTDLGKIKYQDLNGDGKITAADKTYIGNPNPKYIFGVNSTMAHKGLELTLFLQGSQGNDIFNLSQLSNTLDYGFGINNLREVLYDHWTPTTPNAKYPIISRTTSALVSNRFVEDGSYVRLRTVQLAYTLPLQTWGVTGIRSAQIYASGQNLLTFTKYSWWDPEVNSQGGSNSVNQGIDYYTYPTAKTITFGVRIGF